jgi:hypothetical protein
VVSVGVVSVGPPANNHHRSIVQQSFWQSAMVGNNATASIDDGYVDDAGLIAHAAAIEHQFGLVCDLAGVPGHLFPEGYDRT